MHTHCTSPESLKHTALTVFHCIHTGTQYLSESVKFALNALSVLKHPNTLTHHTYFTVSSPAPGICLNLSNLHTCFYLLFQNCILNVVLQLLFSVCRRVPIPFVCMGILVLGSGTVSSLMQSDASWCERASAPSAEDALGSPLVGLSLPLWRRDGGTPPILFTFLLQGT